MPKLSVRQLANLVLLVVASYCLVATSEGDEPSVSSERILQTIEIAKGETAQVDFQNTQTGTDNSTFRADFDITGAKADDVFVEVPGQNPESLEIFAGRVTCSSCGESISIRFTLRPESDLEFASVFLDARSEIWAEDWSDLEGVSLELSIRAFQQSELIVLAESEDAPGIHVIEITADPSAILQVPGGTPIAVFGLEDETRLLPRNSQIELKPCAACEKISLLIGHREPLRTAPVWRIVSTDPEVTASARTLEPVKATANRSERDVSVSDKNEIIYDVVVSVDGPDVAAGHPPPSIRLHGDSLVAPDARRPLVSHKTDLAEDNFQQWRQKFSAGHRVDTGWERRFTIEFSTSQADPVDFEAEFEAEIEWIDEYTSLDADSLRIDVVQR